MGRTATPPVLISPGGGAMRQTWFSVMIVGYESESSDDGTREWHRLRIFDMDSGEATVVSMESPANGDAVPVGTVVDLEVDCRLERRAAQSRKGNTYVPDQAVQRNRLVGVKSRKAAPAPVAT